MVPDCIDDLCLLLYIYVYVRVNFRRQVNSDTHLQTVEIPYEPSYQNFHCLLS